MEQKIAQYFTALARLAMSSQASRNGGAPLPLADAFAEAIAAFRRVTEADGRILFIGNGGSAGIASHMAIDFTRNGGMAGLALNDGAALTCIGNDYGYEHVFARQIQAHARAGDLLIAISSSGRSANILKAVEAARARGCSVLTLSGFAADNPLRRVGDLNFYVASDQYGFVEVAHQGLLHAMLDLAMGWNGRVHIDNDALAAGD